MPCEIVLQNVVTTAWLGVPVDLVALSWQTMGEYNPDAFAAVAMRIDKPKTTALVFSTGKVVCTGAKSERGSKLALHRHFNRIRAICPDAQLLNVRVQNIVASAKLPGSVDIPALASRYTVDSFYTPELFPGLRLKLRDPDLKALVFLQGKLVITGGKTRADILNGWRRLHDIVRAAALRSPPSWRRPYIREADPTGVVGAGFTVHHPRGRRVRQAP